ncbi:uncharacterized protein LOC141537086 [Cotesia typhae]|uniref:uncharacterized protein LOC141537086 n=1 Tax=Cotesia typhae TaxID=2053667 RepID=UPI003D68456D
MYPEMHMEYINHLHAQNLSTPVYPSMGGELFYSAFVPRQWLEYRSVSMLENIVIQQLNPILSNDNAELEDAVIIINDIRTLIFISHQCLVWTFMKDGDDSVDELHYIRVNNWTSGLFFRLINHHAQRRVMIEIISRVMNTVDDEV